jgi:host factor-I protein
MLDEGSNVATPGTPPIQDMFLNHLRDNKLDVTMFLVNGIRLQGQIRQFDNFTVMLVRGSGRHPGRLQACHFGDLPSRAS